VLTHYSPDAGYQDWLGVGMALHHESQGSDRGLDLWDEWSATGATYKGRDDLLQHWDSFGKRSGGALKTMAGLMATVPPSADEFEDLDETETSATYKPRFKILTGSEFIASQGPLRWLVKGLLPKADVGILFGESGAGKTFIVLDLVMAIARGVDSWRGHRVRKGRVLYIVAEGAAGFQNRLQAYARHHQVSPDLLNVIADAPNLLEPRTVADLLSDIKAVGVYDLVVVDTLAKTTPGANENASEDMGRALAHCARVSRDTGAMVLLIHHSGKDASRGARGWSGLKGAVDVELEVMRDGNDRALQATKQKDGAEGQQYGFRLLPVLLGLDEDGDDVTSCVVEHSDLAAVVRRKRPRNEVVGSNEKIILRTLETLAKASEGGKVMCTDLLHEAAKEIPRGDAKKDKRRDYAFAAFENLERKQRILVDGQWVAFPQDSPSVPV
jgi:RecA/RadA recombinase